MLSEESKNTIDALPKDDLVLEVNKGRRSRFQGDNFAYVQSRLQQLEGDDKTSQLKAELDVANETNSIARDANKIAGEANLTAKKAWRASLLSVVVAVVAIVVSMCTKN